MDESGQALCHECLPGTYSATSTLKLACALCGPGRMQSATGQTTCAPCALGKHANASGLSACSDCQAGSYTSAATTLFACAPCGPGTYQNTSAQSNCDLCPGGTYQKLAGQSACSVCEKGRFTSDATTRFACALCDKGRFQSQNASTECAPCARGWFQSKQGQTACGMCAPGRVSGADSSTCQACASVLEFQPDEGQPGCEKCPVHAAANNDSTSCLCESLFYAIPVTELALLESVDAGARQLYEEQLVFGAGVFNPYMRLGFVCAKCPAGAACSRPGTRLDTVTAAPGFFKGNDGTGTNFLPCLNEACADAGGCAPGYTGHPIPLLLLHLCAR